MSHGVSSHDRVSGESESTAAPKWLRRFADLICQAIHSTEQLAPLGCHFYRDDDSPWEVTLFVAKTEFYGGALDGQSGVSQFMLDIGEVLARFDTVESCYWQAQPMAENDDLGPHVGVEGTFEGQAIWLRITAEPPSQFHSGRVVNLLDRTLHDRW